jgi:DNA-binding response OmpR family regulator
MPGAGKAHTILIVDDQKRLRKGLARSLSQGAFRTLTAASGEDALRLLEKRKVDLVITDLVMPGMDGMTLVRNIRKSTRHVEVVIITAYGSAESMQEAEKLGVAHYLAKPFDLPDLKSKVKELLGRRMEEGDETTKRPSSSVLHPPAGTGFPGERGVLRHIRLNRVRALKAVVGLPREVLEHIRPGNVVRAGGKALRAAAGLSRSAVAYVSPRNVLRSLGKAARAISGLARVFLK